MTTDNVLVSTDWLAENLRKPGVRLVDGSWHMPALRRNARSEFEAGHIPGAVFFDIDQIADQKTPLPHMLPSSEEFAAAVGALGISEDDHVVVYDSVGVVSAARVWWTFRVFGHNRVSALDGGLKKWRAETRELEAGKAAPPPRNYRAGYRKELVRTLAQIHENLQIRAEQVLDARSPGRFAGSEPEPRAGLRGGHIPGSLNVPFQALHRSDGTMAEADELRRVFEAAGADLSRPVVATCGSGVTASVLALALYRISRNDAAIYDGSWTEWGARPETPVSLGAPGAKA